MPQLLEVVRAVLEEYVGKPLSRKQEFRSILDKINSLSDEELDKVYRTIGGGAAVTNIGVQHIGRLLWTGTSIRDFHVIAVTLHGLVLLRKNRLLSPSTSDHEDTAWFGCEST